MNRVWVGLAPVCTALLVVTLTACGGASQESSVASSVADVPAATDADTARVASAGEVTAPSMSKTEQPGGAVVASEDPTVASDLAQPDGTPETPELSVDGARSMSALAAPGRGGDPKRADKEKVGDALFHDPRLSASGKMACASCHVSAHGHADAPGTRLPLGGPDLNLAGMRSSPSTRYQNQTPPFRLRFLGVPSGGFLWDGRADTRAAQARGPFFNPVEMALPGDPKNPKALTDLVRSAPYFADIQSIYPSAEINTDAGLFDKVVEMIEIYQNDDPDYNQYSSKFDKVVAGQDQFTPQEQRGWDLFRDRRRGNCASCHTASGARPLFTNFGYAALGVPRNAEGPKNADPAFFDLGLCARDKPHDTGVHRARYCGLFKTPSLRNVARTAPYFHNAAMASLDDAVRFHFERDTAAQRWYVKADGSPDTVYNDLPHRYWGNLAQGRPFNGHYQPSDADVADLVAFLGTLNDNDPPDVD